jgi:hypothetical protein
MLNMVLVMSRVLIQQERRSDVDLESASLPAQHNSEVETGKLTCRDHCR